MAARFVNIDRDTPLLLPPDMRDWVNPDHMVHFVMDAVDALDLGAARVNDRGTGSAQYPPSMMLALLIYSYATGTFSSRRIERQTYENVAVRVLCADTHPDHDSICKFRRENRELLSGAFHQVLELAANARGLKVGDITVAIDGTKILANASKHSAMSHDHLEKQMKLAEEQIGELLAKAEEADSVPLQEGLSIPEEIRRREDRIAKLKEAKKVIEARAEERLGTEQAEHEAKLAAREAKEREAGRKSGGKKPAPPEPGPAPKDQYNFTDPESRIMKDGGGFGQCYNAQAAVEVESMLIVGGLVSDAPNDKKQMRPTLESVSPAAGRSGPCSSTAATTARRRSPRWRDGDRDPKVYAAMRRQGHGRSVAQLEERPDPPPPPSGAGAGEVMAHRLKTKEGRELYALRKQTVEPAFGIIKEAIGFRRFLLRGLEKTSLEWTLVTTSYNIKRLFGLGMAIKRA
jgi:transposase